MSFSTTEAEFVAEVVSQNSVFHGRSKHIDVPYHLGIIRLVNTSQPIKQDQVQSMSKNNKIIDNPVPIFE